MRSIAFVVAMLLGSMSAGAANRTFQPGSLIIPMDLSYQDTGMFQAYGLIYALLRNNIHIHWVIDPAKTYHDTNCNSSASPCPWDCELEGSGVKCAYPTMSPDFTATTNVIWDDKGVAARDSVLGTHRYRGGPFVIDSADRDAALAIIDVWNDPSTWAANPYAMRTVFHVTTIHEATAAFTGDVQKEMIAAPSIAVFADGNEGIATGYIRAAGIPQSNGAEFPAAKCGDANCGPGTANPDMLTEVAIMGDLGTCAAPNIDHRNGALFRNGQAAYCQIMSMHWDVTDRERVDCDGGGCPAVKPTGAECDAMQFTYNGHEVVAEVREFLKENTHFFAECQAVNAYENTTPNAAWPFLDDVGRDGHFLTTAGTPVACSGANPCSDGNYECVGGTCVAKDVRERGTGFEIADQPASNTVKVLRPEIPYNQFDGMYGTTGGSEPAYNLSSFLGVEYKNNRQVTLLTGPNGPEVADIYMTGYLDGACALGPLLKPGDRGACNGKISYLGGHSYDTQVPVISGSKSQGARLFLNALFEADCVTGTTVGPDADGDGVTDDQDPEPDDPNVCGDSDSDGCDDCSTGHFDLTNDCTGGGGGGEAASGCCDAGDTSTLPGWLALCGLVFVVGRRRRR
ncbi:MAG: hypothetical protein H0V17_08660 [Deltaproteobacteria bacterium]|nr:hypothetical protein [Deltaproteobacteria bacterium]